MIGMMKKIGGNESCSFAIRAFNVVDAFCMACLKR